mmetsp:Transcript_49771/g.89015  ORF Transcript_49771/g.89015 Transcript_49771/m.89015 type:complete len:241 (+) Transcript_49771:1093-1815(+)
MTDTGPHYFLRGDGHGTILRRVKDGGPAGAPRGGEQGLKLRSVLVDAEVVRGEQGRGAAALGPARGRPPLGGGGLRKARLRLLEALLPQRPLRPRLLLLERALPLQLLPLPLLLGGRATALGSEGLALQLQLLLLPSVICPSPLQLGLLLLPLPLPLLPLRAPLGGPGVGLRCAQWGRALARPGPLALVHGLHHGREVLLGGRAGQVTAAPRSCAGPRPGGCGGGQGLGMGSGGRGPAGR